jgi:tRNA threonylcarbamoyladenosine biosynthesis protein TsaE
VVVEWPERIEDVLPQERIWITLSWVEEFRRGLYIKACGPRYESLLRTFRQAAFGG